MKTAVTFKTKKQAALAQSLLNSVIDQKGQIKPYVLIYGNILATISQSNMRPYGTGGMKEYVENFVARLMGHGRTK